MLYISTDLVNAVTSRFENEGVVCPPKLCKTLFTTAGVDNIDHNPSSTTLTDSFHGMAISLVQHPIQENKGVDRQITEDYLSGEKKKTMRAASPAYHVPEIKMADEMGMDFWAKKMTDL